MSSEKRGTKALDHSHHISRYARRYAPSPLKTLQKYFNDDLIPFAGGVPSPDYFPFTSVSADVLLVDAFPVDAPRPTSSASPPSPSAFGWLWRLFGAGKDDTTRIHIPREPRPGDRGLNLTTALNYGPATGHALTRAFIREFTERIHAPAYDDWVTLVHTGNTDGWNRVARMLLNPGDTILVEEWAYASALASARPIDVRWSSVPMDDQGMRADRLRAILAGWDVERDGARPRVIYTVPVGQNPCGTTMGLERKKAIYDVCVEFDLIIAEDDPYFFLQVGEFVPKSLRKPEPEPESVTGEDVERFVASLVPTFLSVDTQGRVIRMETLSKTIAPGMRLGWFTCSPLFADRLERIGETSTQSPCGLGQALFMALISQWTFDGYVRWLRGLRAQYRHRRDFFVDCLADEFDLFPTSASAVSPRWSSATVVGDHTFTVLSAYARGGNVHEKTTRHPLLSFIPPSSGMFVWLELYFGEVPDETDEDGSVKTPEHQFWERLVNAGVLAVPGSYFLPERYALGGGTGTGDGGASAPTLSAVSAEGRVGYLRLSYTPADMETTRRGVKIFAKTLREFSRV